MAQALSKYFARPSRYKLRAGDQNVVRFAKIGNSHQSYSTTLIDISQNGVAFSADPRSKPNVGETVMVELTVPGARQMACYAQVMRSEYQPADGSVFVAVKFQELRGAHKQNLSSGLGRTFKKVNTEIQIQKFLESVQMIQHMQVSRQHWVVGVAIIVILGYFIFW